MRRNFDLSTGLVAIGAAAVLVSLFLEWYAPGLSAWDAFEIVDWALAVLAAGALVALAGETSGTTPPTRRLAWIAGAVALLVVAELIDPPPAASGSTREVGAWIALAGAAALVAGAALRVMRISVTIDVAERERRHRTAAVDARDSERPEDERRGELWSTSNGDPAQETAPPAPESPQRAERTERPGPAPGASSPPSSPPSADDPDRTQPLPAAERPDEAG